MCWQIAKQVVRIIAIMLSVICNSHGCRSRLKQENFVDHKSGPCIRNHLINTVKGQFPSTGAARQKDTVVEMLVWWYREQVVYLGNEGVVHCPSY